MPKRSQEELRELQDKASYLHSQGYTVGEIAEQLNVHKRTVQRWKPHIHGMRKALPTAKTEVPAIQQAVVEVAEQEEDTTKAIAQTLTGLMLDAVLPEITRILESEDTSTTNRLKACSLVGDWSGWGRGARVNLDAAVELLFRAGYEVIERSPESSV